jgi:ATP-dependent RNA helicase DeaD
MVVGTPGRLRDHLERGNLDLSGLRVVVLDEADEMLDMGFREDLEAILDAAPSERRTFLFSATIAKEIAALAKRYQRDAVRIDTVRRNESHSDIEHRAIRVAPNDVEHAIVNLLRYFEGSGALIFCATREAVRHLHATLRERGFGVVQLSGELSQKERADALQALRDGHARACVATDVAARGLDLPELGLVIHAALPANTATLLHRSGRTGRAGRKGVSVLLVPHNKRRQAERLIDVARVDAVWSGAPTPDEIRARDQDRMLQDPLLTAEAGEEELTLARRLIEERGPEAVAAALVRLYRSRLPEPEDLFDDGRPSAPERREPRAPADQVTEGAWFRLPVGRAKNADPKWLVPLICRLGHVTKADIGVIRIFDNETKFQIAEGAEARFQEASRAAADAGEMRIQPTTPPAPQGPRPSGKPRFGKGRPNSAPTDGPRPPRRDGPHRDGPRPPRREGGPRPPRKPRRDA